MEKLTSDKAYELLIKDVINDCEDYGKNENRWIKHCLYVGFAAERIADKLGLDSDYSKALGFIHDIGRKISHPKHPYEGYKYMKQYGYDEEANICLTHSFVNNDIEAIADGSLEGLPYYEKAYEYLENRECTIYDNIIQMCDLFCLEKGFTTIEKRMLDIVSRKGVHDNSYYHWKKIIELREKLESLMNVSLYSLFPEIEEALKTIDEDRKQLENMIRVKSLSKIT